MSVNESLTYWKLVTGCTMAALYLQQFVRTLSNLENFGKQVRYSFKNGGLCSSRDGWDWNLKQMNQEGLQELACIIPHLCEPQEKLISEIMSPQLRVAIKVLCVMEDDAEAQNSSWGSQQNIVLATDLTWFGEASTACSQ